MKRKVLIKIFSKMDDEALNVLYDDYTTNEFDEDQKQNFTISTFRDSTLFLVDCSASMFVKSNDGSDDETPFQKCMKAIRNMYQSKIYGSDKDFLGLVFFGTDKSNCGEDFKHMFMVQDLEQPNAQRIKQLEEFTDRFNLKTFKANYSSSDDFCLDKVLWWCSNMFSTVTKRLDSKRIMIFTRRPNPHENNTNLEKMAKNKAKDLHDIGISIELVPLVLKGESNSFDYSMFYGDILMLSEDEIKFMSNPAETLEELEKAVRSKNHQARAYTHLSLSLGENLNISCSIFNLIRECTKPSKIKLDKKTNAETKTVTRRYVPETGEILFASDTKLAVDVCDKRLTFEQDEIKSIKRFGQPGMRLLGFKSLNTLKPYMYIKPGHFLYPDEKIIEGSTTLFKALLDKCLAKEKYVLCELIIRKDTPARLVALYPQQEELDENRLQITPPGFHVIYLPFADDFRQNDRELKAEKNPESIELFSKAISKLKFSYDPDMFKNPAIQKLWSELEAIALEREQPEELEDLTVPDVERHERRAGAFLKEFSEKHGLDDLLAKATSRKNEYKRKAFETYAAGGKKAKANSDEIDVEAEARSGRLEKLTVPILKDYVKSKGLNVSGSKKDDLIRSIKYHLKI